MIDIITPNETEAEELTGIQIKGSEDAKIACLKLHDAGVKTVIITMGKKALFVYRKRTKFNPHFQSCSC